MTSLLDRIAGISPRRLIRVVLAWLASLALLGVLLFAGAVIYVAWLSRHSDESTFSVSVRVVSWNLIVGVLIGPPVLLLGSWFIARLIKRRETGG